MSQKRLLLSALIIGLVILLGFTLSAPHTTRDTLQKVPVQSAPVPVVTLRDTYRSGLHTLSGSLMAPDACTAVTATTTLGQSASTSAITLALTLASDTSVCLELPTRVAFTTTLTAPASLPISVQVNGSVASTTTP